MTDRCRDSHEYVFMLTKAERYYAAVDEVREGYAPATAERYASGYGIRAREAAETTKGYTNSDGGPSSTNPLGKLPGSVWTIPSEPLIVPEAVKARYDLPDHFAAFPTELVRRIILGWSPSGVCVECGEGRRPVVDKALAVDERGAVGSRGSRYNGQHVAHQHNRMGQERAYGSTEATITGYTCACPEPTAPTRPAVVLDPFGGTGTTAMVARALGRFGISLDLSMDYCRLAKWRVFESGHGSKARERTNREAQEAML